MQVNRAFVSVFIITAIMFSFGLSAYAEGNLHIGTLEIHPFASLEQKYDDNIFLEPKNEEDDDWITATNLGVGLKAPLIPDRAEDFIFNAKYTAGILSFWDNSGQNRVDQLFNAAVDLNFANDLTLKIKDDFKKTADPPNSELTAKENRIRNSAQVIAGYSREKVSFDLGCENIRDDYKNLDGLDKDENIITATANYQIFPKASIFGEYNFGTIEYDVATTNSNSDYNQERLGLKGELVPKLTGIVKAGYKSTDYDQAGKDDFEGFTTFLNLIYELQERSIINIEGERGAVESSYSTNSYFLSNRIGVGLDQQLRERLFLVAGGGYQLNTYPDETTEGSVMAKRKDDIYSLSIGLRYEMKEWIFIKTEYEYKQKDSKFSTFDYKDNQISAKVSLSL